MDVRDSLLLTSACGEEEALRFIYEISNSVTKVVLLGNGMPSNKPEDPNDSTAIYGYIYEIKNSTNGKIYIGQTTDVKKRWREHLQAVGKSCSPVHQAMYKHGIENFTCQILATAKSQKKLLLLEEKFVKQKKSMTYQFGYNAKIVRIEDKKKIKKVMAIGTVIDSNGREYSG